MEPPHAEQAIAAVAAGGEGGTASPGTGLEGAACLTFFCFVQISSRAYGRADLWWLPDVTAWYENVWLLQGRCLGGGWTAVGKGRTGSWGRGRRRTHGYRSGLARRTVATTSARLPDRPGEAAAAIAGGVVGYGDSEVFR